MEQKIFQDIPEHKRMQMLEDNCQSVDEEYIYQKEYSQDEIEVLKHELSEDMIKQDAIAQQLAEVKQEFKVKLKPLAIKIKTTLQDIKHGNREATERVFKLANYETGMMGIYNELGELITSRRLLPDEKQYKLEIAKAVNE